MTRCYIYIILILLTSLQSCSEEKRSSKSENTVNYTGPKLFEDIESNSSGISFSNTLVEDLSSNENLFEYDYFYNGAGVAAIDINNDGLQDLFFCGNQVKNKLYLNKGDFNFEDISETAGINVEQEAWANGVTVVDINKDGFSDIYVCQGGAVNFKRNNRTNLLFINNGDMTFTEKAKEYGLADESISTQALFFDIDQDGDEDCLVMNESFINMLDVNYFFKTMLSDPKMLFVSSNHLYINEGGKFVDKTLQMDLMRPAFTLAGMINDFNEDGYPDIFLGNDYTLPDLIYINKKGKKLDNKTREILKHNSFYTMGLDIADINNDGLKDIFTVDMAFKDHVKSKVLMASMDTKREKFFTEKMKFSKQYMFNNLHLNQGDMTYSEVAMSYDIDKSEWSWTALLNDFDYDGNKDIYITNGFPKYGKNNDFRIARQKLLNKYNNQLPLFLSDSLYHSLEDGLSKNQFYSLEGNKFKEQADRAGLDFLGVTTSAIYVDLDNDGDLDIVGNSTNTPAKIYKNKTIENGGKQYYKFSTEVKDNSISTVHFHKGDQIYTYDNNRVRGYLGTVDPSIICGFPEDWTFDKIVITHKNKAYDISDISANKDYKIKSLIKVSSLTTLADADPLFKSANTLINDISHVESMYDDFEIEVLLPYKQSTWGPALAMGDLDGDGHEDLVLGSANGERDIIYFGNNNGNYSKQNSRSLAETIFGESQDIQLVDMNSDGLLDILIACGSNEFPAKNPFLTNLIYYNKGDRAFESDLEAFVDKSYNNSSSIEAIDIDQDGDMDILVGNRGVPKKYPYAEGSQVLRNDAGKFTNVTKEVAKEFGQMGMISDVLVTDFNSDGKQDFIALGEWTAPAMFRNDGGQFTNVSTNYNLDDKKSWWLSVSEADLNGDGKQDYIFGSVGTAIKFDPSKDHPLHVNAADFDQNGTNDIVLNKDYKGQRVPVRGRECSSQQMPVIKEKFPTFQKFATSSVDEILGKEFFNSLELEVYGFEHLALISTDSGFDLYTLPREAQYHPIMQAIPLDLDDQKGDEIILVGSLYDTEIETTRLDAVSGTTLSFKDGKFKVIPRKKTGLRLNIPAREGAYIASKNILVVAQNNGPLVAYKMQR